MCVSTRAHAFVIYFSYFFPYFFVGFIFCCFLLPESLYHSPLGRRQFVLTLPLSSSSFLIGFLTNFVSYPSLQQHKVHGKRIHFHFNVISLPYDIQRSQLVCIYYNCYFVLIFFSAYSYPSDLFFFCRFNVCTLTRSYTQFAIYFKATSKRNPKQKIL